MGAVEGVEAGDVACKVVIDDDARLVFVAFLHRSTVKEYAEDIYFRVVGYFHVMVN